MALVEHGSVGFGAASNELGPDARLHVVLLQISHLDLVEILPVISHQSETVLVDTGKLGVQNLAPLADTTLGNHVVLDALDIILSDQVRCLRLLLFLLWALLALA